MRSRTAAVVVACLLAVCGRAGVAAAHGDDPRITIDVTSLAPGGALTVHGFDFPYEDDVELALRGTAGDTRLGSATTDLDGAFTHTVAVPVEQPLGAYVVVASDSHHDVTSTPFILDGAPLTEDDGARLDEGDSLLVPMPTAVPGVVAVSVLPAVDTAPASGTTDVPGVKDSATVSDASTPAVVADELVTGRGDSGSSTPALLVVAGIVGMLLAVVVASVLRRRRLERRVQDAPQAVTKREPVDSDRIVTR